jgi:hypothetical protein
VADTLQIHATFSSAHRTECDVRAVGIAVAAFGCGRLGFDPSSGGPNGGFDRGDAAADGAAQALCSDPVLVGPGAHPSLAWSGSDYGVSYLVGSEIRFSSIAAAGTPSAPTLLFTAGTGFDAPIQTSLVWNATEWIAAFDGLGVHATRIDGSGAELGGEIEIAASGGLPSFAQGGGPLRLQWSNGDVMTSALGDQLAGVVTDALTNNTYESLDGAAAWTGSAWAVVWDDSKFGAGCVSHGIYFDHVRDNGTVAGGSGEIFQTSCTNLGNSEHHRPAVAWNGSDLSAAWIGAPGDPDHVYVARVDATTGAVRSVPRRATSGASRVCEGFGVECGASLAWTGDELGIAWDGSGGVAITRTDADGTPRGELAIDQRGSWPSLVWDGARYAVAWERDGNIWFARSCP